MCKVLVLDMQPIEPAVGGGRLRLLGLYHNLGLPTTYIGTFDWPGQSPRDHWLSDTLREIDIPLSDRHFQICREWQQKVAGKTIIDTTFHQLGKYSTEYVSYAQNQVKQADVVIFSHPWIYPLVKENIDRTRQIVVYDSQNVESYLRFTLLDDEGGFGTEVVKEVARIEYELCHDSDIVLACSHEDRELFNVLYEVAFKKIRIVPNGVFTENLKPATPEIKTKIKKQINLEGYDFLAIFIGSAYDPNIEAAKFICNELAPHFSDIGFIIAGGVGEPINDWVNQQGRKNIFLTGSISDEEKFQYLAVCDIAINPMFGGSGTNIKMFDFMAMGLPILSTPVGARGIAKVSGGGLWLSHCEDFVDTLHRLLTRCNLWREMGKQNRKWVEQEFSWESLSPNLGGFLEQTFKHMDQKKFQDNLPSQFQLAHISTIGHKCGIGEYTARIVEAFSVLGVSNFIVSAATPSYRPTMKDLPTISEIGWYYDDETWYSSYFSEGLVSRLMAWGAKCLLLQYHPGFFLSNTLLAFVKDCANVGLPVVILIHNLALADMTLLRSCHEMGCLLCCHSRREVIDAARHAIYVEFIPLFIPTESIAIAKSIEGRDWRQHPPIIATTGFIRHHKGIYQLIDAVKLLKSDFPGVRLLVQCALFPSEDSEIEYEKCRLKTLELDLQDTVIFDTRFLPINQLYDCLKEADLAVLPYDESNEGGSAAAATCLAAGLPLLLSHSKIFDEMREAARSLTDITPRTIAREIYRTLKSSSEYTNLVLKNRNYVAEHSTSVVAHGLLAKIKAHAFIFNGTMGRAR